MKRLFAASHHSFLLDMVLLLIRVEAGIAFMFHGWGKIKSPLNWMGPDASVPGVLQALAAISEFAGGFCWIVGLLTPLASLGLAATMAAAFSMHTFVRGDPFVAKGGGPASELAAAYFGIALLLLVAGPGRLSLDRLAFGRR